MFGVCVIESGAIAFEFSRIRHQLECVSECVHKVTSLNALLHAYYQFYGLCSVSFELTLKHR